jgi:hypothetical protein
MFLYDLEFQEVAYVLNGILCGVTKFNAKSFIPLQNACPNNTAVNIWKCRFVWIKSLVYNRRSGDRGLYPWWTDSQIKSDLIYYDTCI